MSMSCELSVPITLRKDEKFSCIPDVGRVCLQRKICSSYCTSNKYFLFCTVASETSVTCRRQSVAGQIFAGTWRSWQLSILKWLHWSPFCWSLIYVVCGVQDVLKMSIYKSCSCLCCRCLKVFLFFNHLKNITEFIPYICPKYPNSIKKLRIFLKMHTSCLGPRDSFRTGDLKLLYVFLVLLSRSRRDLCLSIEHRPRSKCKRGALHTKSLWDVLKCPTVHCSVVLYFIRPCFLQCRCVREDFISNGSGI